MWCRCLSGTDDVLEISVVRGVGGVCSMCMCLSRDGMGGEEGEWMRELGLGFTNPVGSGVGHVSVFWLRWCGWCRWGVGRGLDQGRERWGGVIYV